MEYFDEYKGMRGTIEYEDIYYGQLLDIEHYIYYHANSIEELEEHFKSAVDNYIKWIDKKGVNK